jgi:cytochrome b/b6/petD-like protein
VSEPLPPPAPAPSRRPWSGLTDKIHTWPYLVRLEMIVATLVMVFLTVWSIGIDAPLEEAANPTRTPNPSKAPWYFLGLQELLVYFDPWFAGVVLPTLIIVGLMVIPYVDINPRGNGYFSLRARWFAIGTFLFGFLVLWIVPIIIGTFLRGPGWYFFAPWQRWDPHKTVAITNVDLPVLLGRWFGMRWMQVQPGLGIVGLLFVAGWLALPFVWWKRRYRTSETLQRLGLVRFAIVSQLFMIQFGVLLKMILRWTLDVKYVLVTPWINV